MNPVTLVRSIFFVAVSGLLLGDVARAAHPNEMAEKIARESRRAMMNHTELKAEASRVQDALIKSSLLEALEKIDFRLLRERRTVEAEIVTKLKAAGLVDPSTVSVIPARTPMRFIAAPGGPGTSHHVYATGLIYHTLLNLRMGLDYVKNYRSVYGVGLDADLVRAAAIWHDMAKTLTIEWSADGVATEKEAQIASTGSHHVLGVAEAMLRGWPAKYLVTLASAHSPPMPGKDLESVVSYLRAAAIIAGKPFEAAGLSSDGSQLVGLPPIEAFINHLDDHDYVLTNTTQKAVVNGLSERGWALHRRLALDGDLGLYQNMVNKKNR